MGEYKVAIGVGSLEYYSYWLKAYAKSEGLVWEGMVDAKLHKNKDGSEGLRVLRSTTPHGLQEAVNKYGTLRMEWEPAWEEVIPKQITAKASVQDEDNNAGSERD